MPLEDRYSEYTSIAGTATAIKTIGLKLTNCGRPNKFSETFILCDMPVKYPRPLSIFPTDENTYVFSVLPLENMLIICGII
jgi:hypothetical protein